MLQVLGLQKGSTVRFVVFWKYVQIALTLLLIILQAAAPFCPVILQIEQTGALAALSKWLEGLIAYLTVATTDKIGTPNKTLDKSSD